MSYNRFNRSVMTSQKELNLNSRAGVGIEPLPDLTGGARIYVRGSAFFFTLLFSKKRAPTCSPSTQAISQRRNAIPEAESTKKNSLRLRPAIESAMCKRAPVADTSCIVQARRHVPSIAIK